MSGRKRKADSFSVTFTWANGITGEPEHEITLTGKQWDALYARCLQLTRRGAEVLASLQVEHIDLEDLTPEKVSGARLFYDEKDLVHWCNRGGDDGEHLPGSV